MRMLASLLSQEATLGFPEEREPHATPKEMMSTKQNIKWQTYHHNMVMTAGAGAGGLTFQRTKYGDHDVALGQAISAGVHKWYVMTPSWSPNSYVGVATAASDTRIYPAGTSAWAMHLHSGNLCSGAADILSARRTFVRDDNSNGYYARDGTAHHLSPISFPGGGAKSPMWNKSPVPRGTPVCVVLDMDAHTLSFAVGDGECILAYTGLPGNVHPYICSGDTGERSLLVVAHEPDDIYQR